MEKVIRIALVLAGTVGAVFAQESLVFAQQRARRGRPIRQDNPIRSTSFRHYVATRQQNQLTGTSFSMTSSSRTASRMGIGAIVQPQPQPQPQPQSANHQQLTNHLQQLITLNAQINLPVRTSLQVRSYVRSGNVVVSNHGARSSSGQYGFYRFNLKHYDTSHQDYNHHDLTQGHSNVHDTSSGARTVQKATGHLYLHNNSYAVLSHAGSKLTIAGQNGIVVLGGDGRITFNNASTGLLTGQDMTRALHTINLYRTAANMTPINHQSHITQPSQPSQTQQQQ